MKEHKCLSNQKNGCIWGSHGCFTGLRPAMNRRNLNQSEDGLILNQPDGGRRILNQPESSISSESEVDDKNSNRRELKKREKARPTWPFSRRELKKREKARPTWPFSRRLMDSE